MTIQTNICHQNPGYDKKLKVTQQNKNHETGEWVDVSTDTIPAGECLTKYVHSHARVLIEETEGDHG